MLRLVCFHACAVTVTWIHTPGGKSTAAVTWNWRHGQAAGPVVAAGSGYDTPNAGDAFEYELQIAASDCWGSGRRRPICVPADAELVGAKWNAGITVNSGCPPPRSEVARNHGRFAFAGNALNEDDYRTQFVARVRQSNWNLLDNSVGEANVALTFTASTGSDSQRSPLVLTL